LIKAWLCPYIVEFIQGFGGEENIKKVVESGVSFWSQLLPSDYKEKALEYLKKHRMEFSEFTSDRNYLRLLIDALSDDLPWFPKAVPPRYVEAEIGRIKKEL